MVQRFMDLGRICAHVALLNLALALGLEEVNNTIKPALKSQGSTHVDT